MLYCDRRRQKGELRMEWLTCLRKTLGYIEEHLEGELDPERLAGRVYLSPFYLQRGFQIVTGYSLSEYIRNRRLYEAARALRETEEKVIDVAARFGYETPESFSKAFSRFHGATPSAVRADPTRIRPFLPLKITLELSGGNKMDYVVSPVWPFKVIGFERVFREETAYGDIPKFWDEICERYCNHTIYAGKAPSNPCEQAIIDNCIGEYGVCIDDQPDGSFRYMIAGRYCGGEVPEGMTVYEIPGGEWAKFRCVGPMPEAMQSVNTAIFRRWLPGNPEYEMVGNCNIEWYSCDGCKTDEDYQSAIWIPVRHK